MEIRRQTLRATRAGGTAGEKSLKYRLDLPAAWAHELKLAPGDRVEMELVGEEVVLRKCLPFKPEAFENAALALGHRVKRYEFYDGEELCSVIYADFTARQAAVENFTGDLAKTAFGVNEKPTWQELLTFFQDRCVPQERVGLKDYLKALGLEEYDPLAIVEKTQGRMAEDKQWLKEG